MLIEHPQYVGRTDGISKKNGIDIVFYNELRSIKNELEGKFRSCSVIK